MRKYNLENFITNKKFESLKFEKFIYRGTKFENLIFNKCLFNKTEFWKVIFENVTFIECNLNQIIFSDVEFKRCKFIKCSFNASSFSHLVIKSKIFINCKLYKNIFNTVILNNKNILPKVIFNKNRSSLITISEKKKITYNLEGKGFDFKKNNNRHLDNSMFYINYRHYLNKKPKKFAQTNLSFKIKKNKFNLKKIAHELIHGNGYVVLNEKPLNKYLTKALKILNKKNNIFKKFSTDKRDRQSYLNNLFSNDESFSKILPKRKIFNEIKKILGENFTCGFYSANILAPGARGQPFHIDYPYPTMNKKKGKLTNFSYKNPINLQIQIMMTDINKSIGTGPTDFIPGTQHLQQDPKFLEIYENKDKNEIYFSKNNEKYRFKIKSLEGFKGKTILFNGLMWHRAGENLSKNKMRITLNMQLLSNYIRPMHKFNKIKKSKVELLNQLSGYNLKMPLEV